MAAQQAYGFHFERVHLYQGVVEQLLIELGLLFRCFPEVRGCEFLLLEFHVGSDLSVCIVIYFHQRRNPGLSVPQGRERKPPRLCGGKFAELFGF